MRKVFLDAGASKGESVAFFRKHHPEADQFEIFCFEPHPENIKIIKELTGITLIEAIVWVDGSGTDMYFGKPKAGSVYADKQTGKLNTKHFVATIDFAKFIEDNFQKEDEIWMKMNIEGSEYQVIPILKKRGLLDWMTRIYIKWHITKIPSITNEKHAKVQAMVPTAIPKWRCDDILPLSN